MLAAFHSSQAADGAALKGAELDAARAAENARTFKSSRLLRGYHPSYRRALHRAHSKWDEKAAEPASKLRPNVRVPVLQLMVPGRSTCATR